MSDPGFREMDAQPVIHQSLSEIYTSCDYLYSDVTYEFVYNICSLNASNFHSRKLTLFFLFQLNLNGLQLDLPSGNSLHIISF